jgi:hypothetical protein
MTITLVTLDCLVTSEDEARSSQASSAAEEDEEDDAITEEATDCQTEPDDEGSEWEPESINDHDLQNSSMLQSHCNLPCLFALFALSVWLLWGM